MARGHEVARFASGHGSRAQSSRRLGHCRVGRSEGTLIDVVAGLELHEHHPIAHVYMIQRPARLCIRALVAAKQVEPLRGMTGCWLGYEPCASSVDLSQSFR